MINENLEGFIVADKAKHHDWLIGVLFNIRDIAHSFRAAATARGGHAGSSTCIRSMLEGEVAKAGDPTS